MKDRSIRNKKVGAKYLIILFLCSILGLGVVLSIATNFFTTTIQGTKFGSSSTFLIISFELVLIGSLGLGLYIANGVENLLTRIPNKKGVLLASVIIIFALFIIFRSMGFEAKILNRISSRNPLKITQRVITPSPIPRATNKPKKLDGGKLFNLVNDYRIKNGLNEIAWYLPLCEYAKLRSKEIKTDWSHEGFIKEVKEGQLYVTVCPECAGVGENLARDFDSEEEALQAWINSPSHKENLDAYWDWGCAMYYYNNYVSFIFGRKR